MISTSYICKTLDELERLYRTSSSQKKAIYFSKLAIIELCGWIEETVDDIFITHVNRKCRIKSNKEFYRDEVVKRNNSFQYKKIRGMLIQLVGIIETERLEQKLERNSNITLLKSYLANLKTARNEAAHTHLKGVTRTYNAPSRTINDFNNVLRVLRLIDSQLRN